MNIWLQRLNIVRLGLFALGYGLTGALVGGTLNRIMVAELGLPLTLVGLLFAADLLISPARVWMGYLSDGRPLWGARREPYMILGAGLAGIGIVLAMVLILGLRNQPVLLAGAAMLAFFLHEVGRNLSHNSFQALIADKFSSHARTRAVTIFEIVTLLGLIMGAGGIAGGLREFSETRLVGITVGVAVVTFVLSLIAAFRNDTRVDVAAKAQKAREVPFRQAMEQFVVGDRQIRMFFILIILVIIGTLAQDMLLEPYGAQVLDMEIAQTSRLTMFWGLGVIAAMLLSGLVLIRLFGQVRVLMVGLVMTIFVFGGVIAIGATGAVSAFNPLVAVMGFGTGLAGAGLLTTIINFTTPIRAGLLMGVWGIAMVMGRSIGGLIGAVIVDLLTALTRTPLLAYGTVFAIEGLLLVVALVMVTRLSVGETSAYREAGADLALQPVTQPAVGD